MFAASKSGSADAKDANFKNVTMLLHGNGTNGAQNNTFVDSSTNNFTITRNGNTTQGTFSPYGSNWSNYFDGSGDTLNTASNAAFGFGSGAWTFEAWVYPTTSQTDNWIIATNDAGKLRMRVGASGYLSFYTDTGSISLNSTTVVTVNAWSHVAICYDGTTLSLYQNGTRTATSNVSISNGSANSCYIGSNTVGGGYWNGYISNARVVKGSAVYSGATYTVPTSPLTAISGTSLLTCADNRFIDDSTNNFTITKNGDVSVQRFSPFNATTAYSTSVIGGSGYFDGSGDYLTLANNAAFNLGANNFTIEAWVYVTATPGGSGAVIVGKNSATYPGGYEFNLVVDTGRTIFFGAYTSTLVSLQGTIVTSLNAWNHVAAVRSGSNWALFVNGVRDVTATSSGTVQTTSSSVYIGDYGGGGRNLTGYSSNIRLVNGSAVYDPTVSTLTVPTAPLTAITNTSLLLNYTNAGILDNAMMNDLETVGNAQISTSVKKFGTGSIAFDGNGDYLTAPSSQGFAFGTGDFTVEGWIYTTSLATEQAIFDSLPLGGISTRTTAFVLVIATTGSLRYYSNSAYSSSTSNTVSTNTWTHFAMVRSSGTIKIYINGTSGLSVANSTNFSNTGCVIGRYADAAGGYMNGYIDDLRITKGVARYTANFTAPTSEFPDRG